MKKGLKKKLVENEGADANLRWGLKSKGGLLSGLLSLDSNLDPTVVDALSPLTPLQFYEVETTIISFYLGWAPRNLAEEHICGKDRIWSQAQLPTLIQWILQSMLLTSAIRDSSHYNLVTYFKF